jgi:hypothetical protein
MTLRDVGEGLSGLWQVIHDGVRAVFSENILDWPIWALVVVVLLIVGIVAPALATVKREEAENVDDGIWGSIWAALIGFCFISYVIFAAFTERHGLPAWLGFVGLISWPILGYAVLLKLLRRWLK